MSHLVSVIVPVYKVEGYIEKCMQSLLDQTYKNFEALIVDDGSPDKSIELAKAVVGDDSRFMFFEKENGGQGSARNLALDNAKGDYIAFLDSDDYYDKSLLETAVGFFSKEINIDIVSFGINRVTEDGVLISKTVGDNSIINTKNDILLLKKTLTNFFWDKIFKKEVISDFRFASTIKTYEDVDLLYRVVYGCNIKYIPFSLYNYVQRVGSTSYSMPLSFLEDKISIANNAMIFLKEKSIFYENKQYYYSYYLIEVFYKPLKIISSFSSDYKYDVSNLMAMSKNELLTFKNIFNLHCFCKYRVVFFLALFKINKNIFYRVNVLRMSIKGIVNK